MNRFFLFFLTFLITSCTVKKSNLLVKQSDVERIIRTLSSDEMQGRAIFTPGIDKAAKFIEGEFTEIGLEPMSGQNSFRQEFSLLSIAPENYKGTVNGVSVDNKDLLVITDIPELNWTQNSSAEVHLIKDGVSFMTRYKEIMALKKPVVVFVDEQFVDAFNRLKSYFMAERVIDKPDENKAAVFILGEETAPASYEISFKNKTERSPLFNVAGIIPGKTKPNEYVIFSGHYDHLGIIEAADGDSIANGADDDASGITAVISLAKYYKKLNNNARTLIFAAFTGEESGMLGSKYFSNQLNPTEVVAMFNIEMIGKESKFGKNAAFITGFDRSDFGSILQKNLEGTGFTFHPDPYTQQNLFYRSDNATLAALGVPAHTISTDQIDKDKFYHTVNDEFETLNVENIASTISAIALSSRGIVAGRETPRRIPPLQSKKP